MSNNDYEIVEINAWKIQNGIFISLATFFIGLFLAFLHVLIVFFTPKNYLLNENAAKKQSVLTECRPPPTMSHQIQRKHRNRPTKNERQKNENQFFYIDTTAASASGAQQHPIPPSANFDEEFLDRLKQDIRYYPKLTMKNNEFRSSAFVPHLHGRITKCPRKNVPELPTIGYELKQQQESDAVENVDSFISVISEDTNATVGGSGTTTTKTIMEGSKIPNTPFSRFMTKFIEIKDIEDVQREASQIPIKENDSIYKTLKNVKHGF